MAENDRSFAEDVRSMDIITLYDRLIENGIDFEMAESLEDMQLLALVSLEKEPTGNDLGVSLKEVLETDKRKREGLTKIYNDLVNTYRSLSPTNSLRQELETLYPDLVETAMNYGKGLADEECLIIVAGELGSGKSSIVNLLIGENILPTGVLFSTPTVFRLKNSEEKRVVVLVKQLDSNQCSTLETCLPRDCAVKRLQETVLKYSRGGQESQDTFREIQIYWPIPLLQGNVALMDTPGIGESPEMTQRLFSLLPKAVAFVYVINSANSGGVQENRLVALLNFHTWKMEDDGRLGMFDPSSAIFVLNKWDQVPADEMQTVDETLFKKLAKHWPCLQRSQLYKFTTTEAKRRISLGVGRSPMLDRLDSGIRRLIPISLELTIKAHYRWLDRVSRRMRIAACSRIVNAKKTREEQEKRRTHLTERLLILQREADSIVNSLNSILDVRSDEIARLMVARLSATTTVNNICQKVTKKIPKKNDIEVISQVVQKEIKVEIVQILVQWSREERQFQTVLEEVLQQFKDKCRILDEEFHKWQQELSQDMDLDIQVHESQENFDSVFSSTQRLLFGLTAPLWVPLALAATVVSLPVLGLLAVREALRKQGKLGQFRKDTPKFVLEWVQQAVASLNKDTIKSSIVDVHMTNLRTVVEKLSSSIPSQIQADHQLLAHIIDDSKTCEETIMQYRPFNHKCKRLMGKLMLFHARHFDSPIKISSSDITNKGFLDSGKFSKVYSGTLSGRDGTHTRVAIKVMAHALDNGQAYFQLTEVDILRNLNHPNITRFYGFSISHEDLPHLSLVMELCKLDLKKTIFNNIDIIPSRHEPPEVSYLGAVNFYYNTAESILKGLEYIHSNCYVHRDLKLCNILITHNGTIKISDVGLSAIQEEISGTMCGTLNHMAPEVIECKHYTKAADIYSVGILLWEMWYGRDAFVDIVPEGGRIVLKQFVLKGARPDFSETTSPHKELREVLVKCWSGNPDQRPSCGECLQLLSASKPNVP